ncbi:uncharacterized protein LOC136069463 [Quercus suber]|uniref:uncharacterized protein LOC136069463 n=1 Tax=Quercus suber TaxID=58331 RepID=UPI0032DE4A36
MAELVHSAQNFMNAEDAIIVKKRKRAERMEANPTRHSEQGPCPKKGCKLSIEERRIVAEPTEVLEDVLLQESDLEKFTRIGTSMKEKAKKDLVQFLRDSIDVFAWSHDDMPGIDPSVITHRLNVFPSSKLVRQKKRVFAPEQDKAIKEEVQKLTTSQFIWEVYYPDWLANVVMVKKANASHQLLSFIDAFSGYNQIKMNKADQEKISFITNQEFTPSYDNLDKRKDNKKWVNHVNGSSTLHVGGIRVVLQSPERDKLKHKVRLQYQTINNEVEYETLLKRLELAKSVEADSILVLGDSQLVIGQVNGTCEAKEDRMKRYLKKVVCLVKKFKEADFVQIPREENMEADTLANEASTNKAKEEFDEV